MSRNSAEIKRRKERRNIATTIGYCFVIVLVVLMVMSNILTENYTVVLESEGRVNGVPGCSLLYCIRSFKNR